MASPRSAELQSRINKAKAEMKNVPRPVRNIEPQPVDSIEESNLRTIVPDSDDSRELVLSDGRVVRINPIKLRHYPRWSGYFFKLASLGEMKDGKFEEITELTPERLSRFSAIAPELGELFLNLMGLCLDGATIDDLEEDDAFNVVSRFNELNITPTFMGKVMALTGMRG